MTHENPLNHDKKEARGETGEKLVAGTGSVEETGSARQSMPANAS